MADGRVIDWHAIELDYRAGVKTLREIAEENGVSHPTICIRAKRKGWIRNLLPQIQARANDLVEADAAPQQGAPTEAEEAEIVEANAQQIASVRLAHRSHIRTARETWTELLAEFRKLEDRLPIRIKAFKDLMESLRSIVAMDREAWGVAGVEEASKVNDAPMSKEEIEDLARRVAFMFAVAAKKEPDGYESGGPRLQ